MSKWDKRFLGLAHHVATWSKDRTQVGSVIVEGKRIVSLGFNGFPSGIGDDERLEDYEAKLAHTVHAEMNAILYAKRDLKGCTLYVTHPPCPACAGVIIQAGIKEVISKKPPEGFYQRWGPKLEVSRKMFNESGVTLRLV